MIDVNKYRNPLDKSELRNKSCICGSKKKIKACCGSKNVLNRVEMDIVVAKMKAYNMQLEESVSTVVQS